MQNTFATHVEDDLKKILGETSLAWFRSHGQIDREEVTACK